MDRANAQIGMRLSQIHLLLKGLVPPESDGPWRHRSPTSAPVGANCSTLATGLTTPAPRSMRATASAPGRSALLSSLAISRWSIFYSRAARRSMHATSPAPVAVEGDRTAVAQLLIERNADVNLAGRSGVTRMAAAAYRGNDAVVEALLNHGADDRVADQTGKLPIVYAAAGARFDVARRLLARGARIVTLVGQRKATGVA